MDRQRLYHVRHPWVKFVCWARRRCDPRASRWKPFYFDKGITCHIDSKDTQKIWIRDDADKLTRPSLDRINPNFGYVPWNIRFIEFEDNVRMGRDAKHDRKARTA
jgi:hypothetical protein